MENILKSFVEGIAALKKAGEPDPDNEGQPFEPSDGVYDSHDCLMKLIDEAREIVAKTTEAGMPAVVLEINGGVINCARSDQPVRLVILDQDTEGGDDEGIMTVNDEEVYVHDYTLRQHTQGGQDGIDPEFVKKTLAQLDGVEVVVVQTLLADEVPIGTEGRLVTLDGEEIVGTHEVVWGTAGVITATRNTDGTLTFEHDGGTNIDWNSQKTVKENGEIIFITASDTQVPASQVKLMAG